MSSSPGVTPFRSDRPGHPVDAILASILRAEPVVGEVWATCDLDLFVRRADWHGVGPLVAARLAGHADVPPRLADWLQATARQQAALDLVREAGLRALLEQWAAKGLRPLIVKGAHLAYAVYPRPDLRPRLDTDVVVAEADRAGIIDVLTSSGYENTGHVAGTLVMTQACYVRPGDVVDVHWKLANPKVFADLISYEELAAEARPIRPLGPAAYGLSDVHALLVACVHRVAHHYDSDRLIWLYDIHLLASRLSAEDWQAFATICAARGVRRVCGRGLARAAAAFGTVVPPSMLEAQPTSHAETATAAFLNADRPHIFQVLDDLRALPSWRARARLVGQHLFPSPGYMRHRYAPTSSAPLAVLYVRRAVHGAWKWVARP